MHQHGKHKACREMIWSGGYTTHSIQYHSGLIKGVLKSFMSKRSGMNHCPHSDSLSFCHRKVILMSCMMSAAHANKEALPVVLKLCKNKIVLLLCHLIGVTKRHYITLYLWIHRFTFWFWYSFKLVKGGRATVANTWKNAVSNYWLSPWMSASFKRVRCSSLNNCGVFWCDDARNW